MSEHESTTRDAGTSESGCSIEHRALLWDAINQYVEACGGEPHRCIYGNTRRQQCVVEIERIVYQSNPTADRKEKAQ